MGNQLFETEFLKGGDGEWELGNALGPSLYLPHTQLFNLSGGWGHMDFLNIPTEEFNLFSNKYKTQRGVQTMTRIGRPLFEISYMIKGSGIIDLNNQGALTLHARQFNITYTPYTECKTTLQPKLDAETLDIYLSYDQLYHYHDIFPEVVEPFLEAAQTKRHYNFKSVPLYLTGKIYDQALRVSQLIHQPTIAKQILPAVFNVNVQSLITDTFRYLDRSKSKGISNLQEQRMKRLSGDIFKIIGAEDINIEQLASYVDLSIPEFKGLLGEWYNKVPRNFIFELKMTAARRLIQENISFQEVASRIGYSTPEIFSQRFKYIYGIAPREYKYNWKKRAHCDQRFGLIV